MAHVKTDITVGFGPDSWCDAPAGHAPGDAHDAACRWGEWSACACVGTTDHSQPDDTRADPDR